MVITWPIFPLRAVSYKYTVYCKVGLHKIYCSSLSVLVPPQIMFAVQKALDEKGGDGPAVLPHHLASFTGVNKVYVSLSFIITKYSINYIRLKMPLMIQTDHVICP